MGINQMAKKKKKKIYWETKGNYFIEDGDNWKLD